MGLKFTVAHHFDFGTDPNLYKTEAAAKYTEKPFDPASRDGIGNPYKNNYKIGDGGKGQHNHYTSVYKEDMTEKPIIGKGDNKRHSAMDQIAQVNLGGDGKFQGISEFTDK